MFKIVCIKDHTDRSEGIFGMGSEDPKKIEGLTKGKEYLANLSVSSEIVFFLYNDDNQWAAYPIELFKPA